MLDALPDINTESTQPKWRAASAIEQQIWLDHQQVDDCRHQSQLVLKLRGNLDVLRLAEAIKSMAESLPDIDARYRFDSSLGLVKAQCQSQAFYLKVERTHNLEQALVQAHQRQAHKRDLSGCAPLEFILYCYDEHQFLLVGVAHRIAFSRLNWQSILTSISSYYRHDWQGALSALEQAELRPLWLIRDETTLLAQRWQAFRQPSYLSLEAAPQPVKCAVINKQFPINWLSQYLDNAMDHQALLRRAGEGFAQQVSAIAQTDITHFFMPEKPHQHGEWNGNWMTTGLGTVPVTSCQAHTYDHLPNASWSLSSLAIDALHIGVSWMADASQYLVLSDVEVSLHRTAMPRAELDLMLGLGISCDGLLMCQLTVSERVSTALAEYALDGFIEGLATGKLDANIGICAPAVPFKQGAADHTVQANDADRLEAAKPLGAASSVEQATERHITKGVTLPSILLDVFRNALQHPDFALDDDFFDAGGHSLIATRILGQLKQQHGIELRINDVFSKPTVRQLAQLLAENTTAPPMDTTAIDTKLMDTMSVDTSQINNQPSKRDTATVTQAPLALAQQSLWKVYSAFGYGAMFNIPFALRFLKPVDETLFKHAFEIMLARHDILRTLFVQEKTQVIQRVVSLEALPQYTWFWHSIQSGELSLKQWLDQEAHHPFDLACELPIRLRFVTEVDTGRQYLSFLFHHIVLDEWSVNILIDELILVYHQLATKQSGNEFARMGALDIADDLDIAQKPVASFLQFAQQQGKMGVDLSHLDYWTQRLRGIAPGLQLSLLSKLQCNDERALENKDAGGWQELKINEATRNGLYQLAKACQGSLFNVMYSGITLALRALGAQDTLLVGTPVSGRVDAQYFDTIGYFTTIAVHPVHFSSPTLTQFIETVKNTINDSMPYTDVPIDHIEQALFGDDKPFDVHMFDVFIQLHAKNKLHGQLLDADHQPIPFEQVDPDKSESPLGLQFEVMEETVAGQPTLRLLMSYRSDRYHRQQVDEILQVTEQVLDAMAQTQAAAMSLTQLLSACHQRLA